MVICRFLGSSVSSRIRIGRHADNFKQGRNISDRIAIQVFDFLAEFIIRHEIGADLLFSVFNLSICPAKF